jgi:hypothetical protein
MKSILNLDAEAQEFAAGGPRVEPSVETHAALAYYGDLAKASCQPPAKWSLEQRERL